MKKLKEYHGQPRTLSRLGDLVLACVNQLDTYPPASASFDARGRPKIPADSALGRAIQHLKVNDGLVLTYSSPASFVSPPSPQEQQRQICFVDPGTFEERPVVAA